jgi:hypothetical protein
MTGLLLLTFFRGCSKCFHGVIRDATLRESECDTCEKSMTPMTLATMKMQHRRSEEFYV